MWKGLPEAGREGNPLAELLTLSVACEAMDGSDEHDRDLYSEPGAPEACIGRDSGGDAQGTSREGVRRHWCMGSALAPGDVHHAHARETFAELLSRNALMVTSNYIIDETVTWLRMRAGHADAAAFRDIIAGLQECNRLHLALVSESVEQKARGTVHAAPRPQAIAY